MPPTDPIQSSKRVLTPNERISEILFGLIMVTTFTGSLSVATAGRDDVRAMLIGAVGCNLAWGIIDAILYLMGCLAEKGHNLRSFRKVRSAADHAAARLAISGALPPLVASVLQPEEFKAIHERLLQLPEPPHFVRLSKEDWIGALGVFLLVFLATFPVVIPFLLMQSATPALRVSNTIAVVMLFVLGYAFGRGVGHRPWLYAVSMVVLGVVLVALTIALGG